VCFAASMQESAVCTFGACSGTTRGIVQALVRFTLRSRSAVRMRVAILQQQRVRLTKGDILGARVRCCKSIHPGLPPSIACACFPLFGEGAPHTHPHPHARVYLLRTHARIHIYPCTHTRVRPKPITHVRGLKVLACCSSRGVYKGGRASKL
jgi:hypothetical protein